MILTLIKQTLAIHDGEERPLCLLFVYAFFVGITLASFFAASSSLFLSVYSSNSLPYVYIIAAIVSSLTGGIYALCNKYFSLTKLLYITQIFLLISVLAFWIGLQSTRANWAAFGVLVWFTVLTALIHVAFWGLATRLLDVRQGKRLFGLVGAGEMVASVISGLATPLFVPLWGTIHLLLVAAIGLVGGLVILSIIVRTYTVQIQATAPVANTATSDAVKLLKIPYVRLLFILYLFSVTVLYFLDYGFLDRAQTQFQNEDDLARFFGVFYGISQGLSLLLLTFATGRLFNRFGIRFGMRLRPIVLLVCTLSMVAVGLSNEATLLLFYLAISTKLCDLVLWKSFSSPSSLILYQPLPPDQKLATQLSVETMISPIAGGIAGLALLGLNLLDTHRLLALNASTAILIVGWLLVGMLVFRAYRNVLSEALVRRRLEDNDLSWKESNIIDILHRYLKSPHAGEVIYALDLLEQNDALNNETDLPDLLKHPSPDVRRNALNRMGRLSPIDLMPDVRRQVEMESDPEVLSAALVAWCELGETDVVDDVAPYLDHDTPEVRKGAMVGLLRSGGIDGILLAGRYLLALEQSTDPGQRAFIAQVLGDVGIRSFYHPLLKLLRDPNSDVRREAIIAAGKVKSPRLWAQVIQNLMGFSFHSTAISAFVTAGEESLPILTTTFENANDSPEYQIRIAQVLGRIKGSNTIAVLKRHLNTSDGRVRTQLLKALHQCDYRAEHTAVIQYVRIEVESVTELLASLVDIGTDSTLSQIRKACFEEIDHSRQRCFYLLSFLYDATTIMRAQDNLHHTAPQQKAYALEVLHTTLTRELSTLILPLCESTTSAQRLTQFREHFPQQPMSCQDRLRHIALQTDRWMSPWLRANALYNLTDHTDFVTVLFDRDELVRETAIGMLFQMAADTYKQYAAALKQDPNIRISRAAQNLERWAKGGQSVLLTLEKVMVLKSVDIFANVSEDVLASLSPYLNEMDVPRGENVYEKGGVGNTIYIIVEGQVRVHDGENNTLILLEERDFFGELTTLDPQPHAATTTASKDTRLLGLDRDTLYELMSDYPEMLKSIVQILCQRLRGKHGNN